MVTPEPVEVSGSPLALSRDAELMRRLARRDPTAMADIATTHWQPLVGWVAGIVGNRAAAEDIVQEAFLRLWRREGEWVPNATIRTFLWRIARNLALNARDGWRVRSDRGATLRLVAERPSTPLEELEGDELRAAVEVAIAVLPPRRREVFLLARIEGLSHREIAVTLGISMQTVANQMSAALTDLRRSLARFID
jgi:RNA polymerase sigma-70 factor (ECF subfamily)